MNNKPYFEVIIGYDLGLPIIHRIYIYKSVIERTNTKSLGKTNKGFRRIKVVKMFNK